MSRSLLVEELLPYKKKYFIETGTYAGGGIEIARICGFDKIISIEIDDILYKAVSERYQDIPNIKILHGDSSIILQEVLKEINIPTVIFLDAHSEDYNPIFNELLVIGKHNIKTHTLLIDDLRVYNGVYWKETIEDLINAVYKINTSYKINYMDSVNAKGDILVAWIP